MAICVGCEISQVHYAKGLCNKCYQRARLAIPGIRSKAYAQNKRWVANHPQQLWQSWLKNRYNMTGAEYNELFDQQNGKCALCGGAQSRGSKRLGVDHNHETGAVRGLLCHSCNVVVGYYEKIYNDPVLRERLELYVQEKHMENVVEVL